jgi:hypothetical protein
MKALTVRQPWASLITAGLKDVENRTWRTNFRGTLLVHAGRVDRLPMLEFGHLLTAAPLVGAVVGTVEVVDCVRDSESPWAIPGQWHWTLDDPQPLAEPVLCRGWLGLWDVAVRQSGLTTGTGS